MAAPMTSLQLFCLFAGARSRCGLEGVGNLEALAKQQNFGTGCQAAFRNTSESSQSRIESHHSIFHWPPCVRPSIPKDARHDETKTLHSTEKTCLMLLTHGTSCPLRLFRSCATASRIMPGGVDVIPPLAAEDPAQEPCRGKARSGQRISEPKTALCTSPKCETLHPGGTPNLTAQCVELPGKPSGPE